MSGDIQGQGQDALGRAGGKIIERGGVARRDPQVSFLTAYEAEFPNF